MRRIYVKRCLLASNRHTPENWLPALIALARIAYLSSILPIWMLTLHPRLVPLLHRYPVRLTYRRFARPDPFAPTLVLRSTPQTLRFARRHATSLVRTTYVLYCGMFALAPCVSLGLAPTRAEARITPERMIRSRHTVASAASHRLLALPPAHWGCLPVSASPRLLHVRPEGSLKGLLDSCPISPISNRPSASLKRRVRAIRGHEWSRRRRGVSAQRTPLDEFCPLTENLRLVY